MPVRKAKQSTGSKKAAASKQSSPAKKRVASANRPAATATPAKSPAAVKRRRVASDSAAIAPAGPAPNPGGQTTTIRIQGGTEFTISGSELLQTYSKHWVYVLRNRKRWTDTDSARKDLSQRSTGHLNELGISDNDLQQIAQAGVVEVSIPYTHEEVGWEARILPWEFLLSSATRRYRGDNCLLVVRHLERGPSPERPKRRSIQSLLVVESAPGPLKEFYSFDSERELVQSNLELPVSEPLRDPTLAELSQTIKELKSDVIHLAGIDTHQGVRLLKWDQDPNITYGEDRKVWWDGMFMRDNERLLKPVKCSDLALAFNSARAHPPALVSCNLYNSAARLAAMIVAEGAEAAIGFQDEIDDALAELFFANFYRAWRHTAWDILSAFHLTWKTLIQESKKLRGTGIVLWSATSLLKQETRSKHRAGASTDASSKHAQESLSQERAKPVIMTGTGDGGLREILKVEVEPFDQVNYSLLHNNRGLFKNFKIRKLAQGRLSGIRVKVVLYVGSDSFPYETSFDLDQPIFDAAPGIKVPMTSMLARSIRESIHTSLFVAVSYNNQDVYCDTHRVTLLAVDEWRDDDRDRNWLPSFVLPRDPAVSKIVDSAQRYLMSLKDDSGAGFDGYQSYDAEAEDPSEGIDMQVRALWSALSFDLPLSYINPPPTFTTMSQRLRTPGDILRGKRGTCIDLALLLAACLEYIEIYPVIFLLEGHAFPGYWRSEAGYQRFNELRYIPTAEVASPTAELPEGSRDGQRVTWAAARDSYYELLDLVRSGDLVPLESVWLTQHKGFWEAVEDGVQNLRSERDFHSMIDIILARSCGVTPLPIAGSIE